MKKFVIMILACQMFMTSAILPSARAELITTQMLLTQDVRQADRAAVDAFMAREDVKAAMTRMGVPPEAAEARVAALSPAELSELSQKIDALPAGAGLLEVVGIAFVLLIILDLVGVTNVFSKI